MGKKMTISGTVLKWGNSYGIRLSKDDVKAMQLQEKEKVELVVKKIHNPLKELFGSGKDDPITREEFLRSREGFVDSKWLD